MAQSAPRITEYEYIPLSDRDEQHKTVFVLRPLSTRQRIDVTASLVSGSELMFMQKVLRYGMVTWRGLKDADGNDVPFSKNQDENFDNLSVPLVNEVAQEIMAASELTEDDRKN